ncbi:hypothetical protein [Gallaecimonas mangrovi]|uniref:hypothetical protein n=1 Tax=Gallaecimonas mangrovi TaxID=2291597 RepID=UPI000E206631|nr:hypothetical protein [Gallaecimonas mangrovi]
MRYISKIISLTVVGILTLQLSGCGLLLHPERQGQRGGRIDPAIAIFDGVGLLFFVVPGLVAFGIDFYQGTIYLPGTAQTGPKVIKMTDPSIGGIEKLLEQQTGHKVDLKTAKVSRYQPGQKTQMLARLQSINAKPAPMQLAP